MISYDAAFSRNIGWVTATEQRVLRRARVAIAGMGGVGGVHLLTLARLGVGRFSLSDFDRFDVPNFNRQAGAMVSTLGQPKLGVMAAQTRDINPEVDLRLFDTGIDANNVEAFLDDVDLYVDGLDFFAFGARALVFKACARRGIPAITAAPIGMGTALLTFMPGRMTFEEYFGWEGADDLERALRFVIGLAPAGLHRPYLVDPGAVSLASRRTPSTAMACQMCAGLATTEALKVLLKRGELTVAPRGMQFDAYRGKLARTWRPGGHRNLLQRITLAIGRRQMAAMLTKD
jgi:molybdopterin/thiamine biosynthesis adenylyltransferase